MINPNPNREYMNTQRQKYMNHEITHTEYYLWLADFIGVSSILIPATDDELANSTDPHLNDIPLRIWDAAHSYVQRFAFAKHLPWSNSDTVCVLKELALKRKNSPEFIKWTVLRRLTGAIIILDRIKESK